MIALLVDADATSQPPIYSPASPVCHTRVLCHASQVSTWVQDCGDYWRLSGQTIPESVCLNGPTAAAAATTTVYTAAIFGLAAVVAFLA